MTFAAIWTAIRAGWAAVRANPALLWTAIGAGALALLEVAKWWWKREGASEARQEIETDALKDEKARLAKGREAVRDGRDAGTPADRLRQNDGRW